jgi:SPP1 gp7 family putative phage head morphogenesis protein
MIVGAHGTPPGAVLAVETAYLLVVRGVHAEATGTLAQDGMSDFMARALKWIVRAVRTIVSGVDEDLHKLPGIDMAKAAGSQKIVNAFQTRNVNLIKTVATQHLSKVQDVLQQNSGVHVKGLTSKLQETLGVSESRAKLWARDQTLKLHADIVQSKHESLGIVEYNWRTSKDGTVRHDHAMLEGKRFRYDAPPVVNTSRVAQGAPERRRNPGKDYECRCHADPVLPA